MVNMKVRIMPLAGGKGLSFGEKLMVINSRFNLMMRSQVLVLASWIITHINIRYFEFTIYYSNRKSWKTIVNCLLIIVYAFEETREVGNIGKVVVMSIWDQIISLLIHIYVYVCVFHYLIFISMGGSL